MYKWGTGLCTHATLFLRVQAFLFSTQIPPVPPLDSWRENRMRLPLRLRLFLLVLLCATRSSGTLVEEVIDGIGDAIDCVGCHAFLVPAQFLAYFGDSVFSRVWIAICQITQVRSRPLTNTAPIQRCVSFCRSRTPTSAKALYLRKARFWRTT